MAVSDGAVGSSMTQGRPQTDTVTSTAVFDDVGVVSAPGTPACGFPPLLSAPG